MIARLKGIIEDMGDTWVIIDVNGVGYLASCSRQTLTHMGAIGEATSLHIETVLRQDNLQLYGFSTLEEKEIFLLLTTVQGVGMRVGLALLSALTPDQVLHAIATQDKTAMTRADGVGPKLASRILSELKDKVPQLTAVSTVVANQSGVAAQPFSVPASSELEEAISALINLGYRRSEAQQAIQNARQNLGEGAALSDLIRVGLANMGRIA
jgi:Holliday junction DNA helicase RuvA